MGFGQSPGMFRKFLAKPCWLSEADASFLINSS